MEDHRIIDCLTRMEERMVDALKSQMDCGLEALDASEAGEVADIIKDLAEAKKHCLEAKYYKTVTEAMENEPSEKVDNILDVVGYAPRTAPNTSSFRERVRMGYSPSMMPIAEDYGRYGKAYNEYQTAKRHYTMTNSAMDKTQMDAHATEHLNYTITSIREMWADADPEMKRRIKDDLTHLIAEIK